MSGDLCFTRHLLLVKQDGTRSTKPETFTLFLIEFTLLDRMEV